MFSLRCGFDRFECDDVVDNNDDDDDDDDDDNVDSPLRITPLSPLGPNIAL